MCRSLVNQGLPAFPFIAASSIMAELAMLQATYAFAHMSGLAFCGSAALLLAAVLIAVILTSVIFGLCFSKMFELQESRGRCAWTIFVFFVLLAYLAVYHIFGYGGDITQALTERRVDLYFSSFYAKILSNFWAAADLLNEST